MASRLVAVTFEAADPALVARFWAGLLDRHVGAEDDGLLLPGGPTQVGLRFVAGAGRHGPNRLHLHLTSTSPDDQQRTVERALALGGRHLDVGQLPDEEHVVLADPGGDELCVIEPGNRFLAGCGPLGEVACDGSRQVGLFWAAALDWPLVWDEGDETAVQSPYGGTKVSWGGATPGSGTGSTTGRQRFDLVADDPAAEADRLVGLGATLVSARTDATDLLDPGGGPFRLRDRERR